MASQHDPIRFGIIGLGVGRSRVKQAANTAGAQLVAVCDLQESLATAQAAEYGCDWHTDHRALLERQDIDAVGIFNAQRHPRRPCHRESPGRQAHLYDQADGCFHGKNRPGDCRRRAERADSGRGLPKALRAGHAPHQAGHG